MTPILEADELVQAFNASTGRGYWTARIAGGKDRPAVNFNSRSSMLALTYYPDNKRFAVTFSKVCCAFGDFMASTYAGLWQVLQSLKASGHEINVPLDQADGELRFQFDPQTKQTYVSFAHIEDAWYDPQASFKVEEKVSA